MMIGALRWAVTTAALVALIAPGGLQLLSWQAVIVAGGSMMPTYGVGDVVVLGEPGDEPLRVGDIVAVAPDGELYLHRVAEVDDDRALLRGDANATADHDWVRAADVRGLPVAHLGRPWAPLVVAATSTPGRLALAFAVVACVVPAVNRRPRQRPVSDRTAEG